MRRQPWSDRISSAAIAACLHVLAILFLGLVSPTLKTPPRADPLETAESVIEVELTRPPLPAPLPRRPSLTEAVRTEAAVPPIPQVLSRPPSSTAHPDAATVIQPSPQPEAPPKIAQIPIPPVAAAEAKPQPLEPPKPVTAPKPAEPAKAREQDKDKEKEKALERPPQTELAAAPPMAPSPAAKPNAAPAPFVPVPGFRLPPGYGRPLEGDGGGGLRGVLRATVGCAHQTYVALTPAEKERCAQALVRDASRGVRVDPVPGDKREAYDVEAAANVRRRAAKEGGTASPVVPCDGPGSNLGAGCLPAEAHTGSRRAAPPQ